VLLVAAVGFTASGCAADPSAVYRDAAVKTLQATLSEARTAELAGRLWVSGGSSHAATVVLVTESDSGVGEDSAWFEDQQPPGRADDPVRARTVDAVDAAASAVQSLRITVQRSDTRGVRAALADLRAASRRLEALAEQLS
jgi:hypothetical protein